MTSRTDFNSPLPHLTGPEELLKLSKPAPLDSDLIANPTLPALILQNPTNPPTGSLVNRASLVLPATNCPGSNSTTLNDASSNPPGGNDLGAVYQLPPMPSQILTEKKQKENINSKENTSVSPSAIPTASAFTSLQPVYPPFNILILDPRVGKVPFNELLDSIATTYCLNSTKGSALDEQAKDLYMHQRYSNTLVKIQSANPNDSIPPVRALLHALTLIKLSRLEDALNLLIATPPQTKTSVLFALQAMIELASGKTATAANSLLEAYRINIDASTSEILNRIHLMIPPASITKGSRGALKFYLAQTGIENANSKRPLDQTNNTDSLPAAKKSQKTSEEKPTGEPLNPPPTYTHPLVQVPLDKSIDSRTIGEILGLIDIICHSNLEKNNCPPDKEAWNLYALGRYDEALKNIRPIKLGHAMSPARELFHALVLMRNCELREAMNVLSVALKTFKNDPQSVELFALNSIAALLLSRVLPAQNSLFEAYRQKTDGQPTELLDKINEVIQKLPEYSSSETCILLKGYLNKKPTS